MRFLVVVLLCLAGCADRGAFERSDPHTGVSVSASDAYLRVLDAVTTLEARVVRLSAGASEEFVIKTFVIRNDLNYPRISQAYSLGAEIDYQMDDRYRIGYRRAEAGHLPMSETQVLARSVTGYSFLLGGPRGSYPFNIPPTLFAQVRSRPP